MNVKRTQWYTREQMRAFQEKRLRKIIAYAYKHIPYYKMVFDAQRIHPQQIQSLEDLKRIPRLTRQQAIEHYDSLTNPAKIFKTHLSSATTGHRLKWAYSKKWAALCGRTLWRGFSWAGLTHNKRVVSFFSRMIGEVAKDSLIIREAFDVNEIDAQLKQVRHFNPQFGYCYASSAYLTARHLLKTGQRLPLEGMLVTADPLFPHYKPIIEEAFQCKVYNNYGCNDGGAWGAECQERCGFHHDFERSIIEFEDDGKMVVTDLWNTAMPLIRYENGDTGKWIESDCRCGREMPLFVIEGRVSDYLITPTQVFSPKIIDMLLRNEYFEQIRLVQHQDTCLDIFYTPNLCLSRVVIDAFLTQFASHFKGMQVRLVEGVCPINSSSNKHRLCMNLSH